MKEIRRLLKKEKMAAAALSIEGLFEIYLDIHGVLIHIVSNANKTVDAVREAYHFFERVCSKTSADMHHIVMLSSDFDGFSDAASNIFGDVTPPDQMLLMPSYDRLYILDDFAQSHYYTGAFFTALMEAELFDDYMIIHGAALVNDQGILIPGALRCGKTTLTLSLLYRGFRFATDDVILLNRKTLQVHAYPRLLNVRKESLSLIPGLHKDYPRMTFSQVFGEPRWFLDKSDCVADPFECQHIIFPQWTDGRTHLAELSKAKSGLMMIQHSFYPHTPSKYCESSVANLHSAARIANSAEVYILKQASPAEGVECLLDYLGH
ncbi:hypothetical protein FMN50_13720 [Rhodobacterales bacterium]|nr:hypothetical protein FMN50_13720 [Rhodobacterales bacterium]